MAPELTALADGSVLLSGLEAPDLVHLRRIDRVGRITHSDTAALGWTPVTNGSSFNTLFRSDGLWVYGSTQGASSLDIFVARLVTMTFTATHQINVPFV